MNTYNSSQRESLNSSQPSSSTSSQQPLDTSIYNFISLIKRHKIVILIPVILAEALALYSYFVLVTYTATSKLIIQKAENSSLQSLSLDLGATKSQLMGGSLAKDTYLETVLIYLNTRDSFEEIAKNLLETDQGKTLYKELKKVSTTSKSPLALVSELILGQKNNTSTDSQAEFGGMLRQVTRYDRAPVPGIIVSITTGSPRLSVQIANALSEQTQNLITRRDLKQLEEGKNYIISKMDEITESLNEVEREMLNIRQRSVGSITQTGAAESVTSLQSIRSELEQNKIKLEQNERLIRSIIDNMKNQRKTNKGPSFDPSAQAILRRQLAALRARKQGLISEGMSEQSPQVLSLQDEIRKTEKQIPKNSSDSIDFSQDSSLAFLEDNTNPELRISELRKENFILSTRIKAANRLLQADKVSKENVPEAEQKYYALNKRLEMKYLLYGELSKQLFNLDVSRIAIQNKVLNVEKASLGSVLRKPSLFPSVPMALIVAFVFGALLAALIENYDPIVVTAGDLPGFNYISLGSIPRLKEAEITRGTNKESLLRSVIFRHKLDIPQTIPFKRIRARIQHLEKKTGQKPKVFSTHSTHSGDGKSFITANIAASFAAQNSKVLLVDCDLRKKALSREFTTKDTKGLSNFLADPSLVNYKSLILANLQPNLDLLPSGPPSLNSSELINSPKFLKLLESAKADYDFVFLDDAPFMALPDSEFVASQSDIILVVASCHKTKVHDLSTMLDHFLQYGEKPICLILNRSNAKNQVYYYYGVSEDQKSRVRAA